MSRALVEDFNRRRQDYWQKRAAKRRAQEEARVSPRNPIASNVNFDCAREMYLGITAWQARPDLSPESQERMADGDVASAAAQQRLRDMGYRVVETEGPMQPFRNRAGKVVYTGRIDCKIIFGGRKIPAEVKDPGQHIYERIETYEDLDRYWWTRKWKGQILVYLLQNNEPDGILVLYCQGWMKLIPVVLEEHLEDAELALSLGEQVVVAVESKTPPPFTKDPTICAKCWAYGRACNPPIEEQGAAVLDADGELHQLLTLMSETEIAAHEHAQAEKRAKEIIRAAGVDRAICGEYAISISERNVKGYEVKARVDRIVKIARIETLKKKEAV